MLRWLHVYVAVICGFCASCFNATYEFDEGKVACDDRFCPPGYMCFSGLCYRNPPSTPDGGGADAGDAGETPCTPDSRRCTGNLPQKCDSNRIWRDEPGCTADKPTCLNGICVEGCKAGTKDCSGRVQLVCDTQGLWQPSKTCDFACYLGGCTGICKPGELRCNGNNVEECGVRGTWLMSEACTAACVLGECTGICQPNQKRCTQDGVPETCSPTGEWEPGAPCAFVCKDGTCTGLCKPGTKSCDDKKVMECDPDGKYVEKEVCPVNCAGGACSGACTNGTTQCSGIDVLQTCTSGMWTDTQTCTNICTAGACDGECKPGTKKCETGIPWECGAMGTWVPGDACTYVCAGTACSGECMPGDERCDTDKRQKCGEDGFWDTLETCAFGCMDGACSGCVPETMEETCDEGHCGFTADNCGTLVDCGQDCPEGQSCGGGGVIGFCGCTPEPTAVTCLNKCGNVTNNCGQVINCTSQNGGITCNPPELCGAGGSEPNQCCVRDSMDHTCTGKCGGVTDNCGVLVECGDDCAQQGPGYTCGGAIPNVCGCTPQTRRCEGTTPQVCTDQGTWMNEATCAVACQNGMCTTACTEGATTCNGNTPQKCIGGVWIDQDTCVNSTCYNGACTGVCVSGTKRCTGTNSNTPQTCDTMGVWQGTTACSHQTCSSGTCMGVCAPTETRCDPSPVGGTGAMQTCSNGAWGTSQACTYTCRNNACYGVCANGDHRCQSGWSQVCTDYQWVNQTRCSDTDGCNNGICCESNAAACPGTPGAKCNTTVTKNCGTSVMCSNSCVVTFSCGGNPASPNVCSCLPGSTRCGVNNTVLQCNEKGDGWNFAGQCPAFCNAGQCVSCIDGKKRCLENQVQECKDGMWMTTSTCEAPNACCEGCGNAYCSALQCAIACKAEEP